MPDEAMLGKLCFGRLVYAYLVDSLTNAPTTEPHWAIIIDNDERVKNNSTFRVVGISHNNTIHPEFMDVPGYTGKDGYIIGRWIVPIHELGVLEVGAKLMVPDMVKVMTLIKSADLARKSTQN